MVRGLKVYIDEDHVGSVARGSSSDFNVSPGTHKLYVKMDWCSSQPVVINLDKDEEVPFLAKPPGNNSVAVLFKPLFGRIFNFNDFCDLKEISLGK